MNTKNKQRARLALAELEKELEILTREEMNTCKGGYGRRTEPYTTGYFVDLPRPEYQCGPSDSGFYSEGGSKSFLGGSGTDDDPYRLSEVVVTDNRGGGRNSSNFGGSIHYYTGGGWNNASNETGMYGHSSPPANDYGNPYTGGYGGGSDGGGNNSYSAAPDTIQYENSISQTTRNIIDILYSKGDRYSFLPSVKNKIPHFSKYILDMFDKSSKYTLTFKEANIGSNSQGLPRNGFFFKAGEGKYEITLDKNYISSTSNLTIARTIIHEVFHAYIQQNIDDNRNATQKSDLVKDLDFLWKQSRYNGDMNLTQHEFMSQFVETMAHSLAVYDNYRHSMEYYTALSWAGLETSSAYQNKTQQEKDAIQKIINYEKNNKNNK